MSVPAGSTQDSLKLVSKQDYVTSMETCEFTYEWTIKNFNPLSREKTISPSFSSHHSDFNDKWILEIKPNGKSLFDNTLVLVDLQLQSFNNTSQLQTKCKISINNENGLIKEYNFSKFPEKITWDIPRSTFLSALHISFGGQNTHKIFCTIIMSKKQIDKFNEILTVNTTPKLSEDWKKLLLSEKSADVTFQVGQKSFRAIKGILAIRSPVFAAMFDHEEFKENKKNEVVIDDIDEDVFEEFLHYIYTDESPNVDKMTMELLAVADKYQVDSLKNICEGIICRKIDFENVASKFVFSDKYNLKKLNKKSLEFMKPNLRAVLLNKTFQAHQKKYPQVFVSVLQELLLSANSVNYI
ncbi:speckle-type POZ protein-like [Aphidius gifuensis]|uniref:speckle-type POZ protein-like n=1 Tax=Aphidius gifuensis TaxID=684658 RepID=UPI001CDB8A9A|nr:speckle-type POZ protein-like [Aphidius gifuensis]